jgi:hypothetical protein
MAGSLPNKDKGIVATVDAHVLGQSIDSIGGWCSTLVVGGSDIGTSLQSRVKGPKALQTFAAFWTRLWIEHDAILFMDILLDTVTVNNKNAAGIMSSLIRKEQTQIKITGSAAACYTNKDQGAADVLSNLQLQGQIWRSKDGTLHLDDLGEESFGQSHHLQKFRVGIMLDKSTDLQLNFGGQANDVWTVGPLTA